MAGRVHYALLVPERKERNWFALVAGSALIGFALFSLFSGFTRDRLPVPRLLAISAALCFGLCSVFAGFDRKMSTAIFGILCLLCFGGVEFAKWWEGAIALSHAVLSMILLLTPALVLLIVWKLRKRA
jgi:hypothetical protein